MYKPSEFLEYIKTITTIDNPIAVISKYAGFAGPDNISKLIRYKHKAYHNVCVHMIGIKFTVIVNVFILDKKDFLAYTLTNSDRDDEIIPFSTYCDMHCVTHLYT